MIDLKLNETPVRTSRNFNCNNIVLENLIIPEEYKAFKNIEIIKSSKIDLEENVSKTKLTYGLGDILEKQAMEKPNKKITLKVNGKAKEEASITFNFDSENANLIENIEIIAEENSKANIYIKYANPENTPCKNLNCENILCEKTQNIDKKTKNNYYHNGIIRVLAKENSNINVTLVNLLNEASQNFISIENKVQKNAKLNFCIVDFGGKNSITNYYTNLVEDEAKNNLNSIYLGKNKQLFDLNYIGELRGKKTTMNIEVQGALNENSKKHFKGTLDFKKGAKKAIGNENEFCMLLSDKAKAIALPMLLCEEEEVEGNHSTAAGKLGNKELFYIMSRGFSKKEAMKLIVRARFNKILETISKEELKNEILKEIDNRLS